MRAARRARNPRIDTQRAFARSGLQRRAAEGTRHSSRLVCCSSFQRADCCTDPRNVVTPRGRALPYAQRQDQRVVRTGFFNSLNHLPPVRTRPLRAVAHLEPRTVRRASREAAVFRNANAPNQSARSESTPDAPPGHRAKRASDPTLSAALTETRGAHPARVPDPPLGASARRPRARPRAHEATLGASAQ